MATATEHSGRGWRLLVGDVRERLAEIPDGSVHCAVTSTPYFGLRDYGVDGQIGLEQTPEAFVAEIVTVCREVKRCLRDDGTFWLNIGDSYAGSGRGGYVGGKSGLEGSVTGQDESRKARGSQKAAGLHERARAAGAVGRAWTPAPAGVKQKELIGVPWMLAFALRADGWYLRSDVIWHKPSAMPESVSDRPSKAHEYIFLLTKSRRYFYDLAAVAEKATGKPPGNTTHKGATAYLEGDEKHRTKLGLVNVGAVETRNLRTVWKVKYSITDAAALLEFMNAGVGEGDIWSITFEPFPGAHFAVFPSEIPARCIKAGTSAVGVCPDCGAPWRRLLEKKRVPTRPAINTKVTAASDDPDSPYHGHNGTIVGNRDPHRHVTATQTVGWEPTCECGRSREEAVPAVVLDPFSGSGTTIRTAIDLGRFGMGVELNPAYAELSVQRITAPREKPAEKHEPADGQKALFGEDAA